MDADIHFCIEYSQDYIDEVDESTAHWRSFGEVTLNRHYEMFSILAGVRPMRGLEPLYRPRGLPRGIGYVAKETLMRFDDASHDWRLCEDYHTYHWLTTGEYAAVLAAARLKGVHFSPAYAAALAAMTALETGGAAARCVFAFDN